MDRCIRFVTVSAMRRAAAAAAMMLVAAVASGALAQTLTNPNPPAKWSPPHAAKPAAAARAQPCTGYGAGFVKLPGSDACIKIGVWVSVEGGR